MSSKTLPAPLLLPRGLIVSVQAPEGSPMRDPDVIAAMAEASLRNGAIGVRLESPEHIGAVRRRCPKALIIGLWKRSFPDSAVYITPGWNEIQEVWSAGADVIAIDATARYRPGGQELAALVQRAQNELMAPLMADVDCLSNGLIAAALGCQWVGTTLYGYTEATA
ncbi:putative N-acetylmannosamine-6-phosphate 2-epimerase, partial [Synechococcus sp.]